MIRRFFVSALVSCLCVCAFAQDEYVDEYENEEGIVFANLEDGLLEELLSEEEVKGAKGLVILGGKPQKEDFQFINERMMDNLRLIDLRHADLDTIPSYALRGTSYIKIICPTNLKHLRSHCFRLGIGDIYITGRFPTREIYTQHEYHINYYSTPNNPYLTTFGYDPPMLYSKDLDTLYYGQFYNVGLIEGTKVIAGHAFEDNVLEFVSGFFIPESVDSIGDNAFSLNVDVFDLEYSCYKCYCYAPVPPKVGKNVMVCNLEHRPFDFHDYLWLYVPDESLDLYKSDPYWGTFKKVLPMSAITGVENVYGETGLRISKSNESYEFSSQTPMKNITFLNVHGQKVLGCEVNERRFVVKKDRVGEGVSICVVTFNNGHKEVVKLL